MRFKLYLKDKAFEITVWCVWMMITGMILWAFKLESTLIIFLLSVYVLLEVVLVVWDYVRKKRFYDEVLCNLERLDKKYLLLETVEEPSFYDGKLFCEILYDVDKSMCENVNQYKKNMTEFKEYIEMWVHEVKIPLASLRLMCHNHKNEIDKKYVEQIRRIDNYTEQVLYFVRSENTEKDFLIKEIELSKLIAKTAINQKDDLLENQIEFRAEPTKALVHTDGKWMEFILNQIVNNAVKYRDFRKESYIFMEVEEQKDRTILRIKDNGIGIPQSDLGRVFDKSFTGENGRLHAKSTGMGLYIAKKLCNSLGHAIAVESEKGQYTTISITFAKNDFYKM